MRESLDDRDYEFGLRRSGHSRFYHRFRCCCWDNVSDSALFTFRIPWIRALYLNDIDCRVVIYRKLCYTFMHTLSERYNEIRRHNKQSKFQKEEEVL